MPIGEICNRETIFVFKDTSILQTAQLMRRHHVGDVIVVEERGAKRIPIGIVTDRDIVIEVIAKEAEPSHLTAGDIITSNLVTARDTEGVYESIQLMRMNGIRRLPIVDADGGLVGIVSMDDLLELLAEEMNEIAKLVSREQLKETKARL